MTAGTLAAELERRFSARPHVGAVTHFEGWDLARTAERAREVLNALGLEARSALEEVAGEPVFSAAAPVPEPRGQSLELWLIGTLKPRVGAKLEMRVFHALEDAALADEYLVGVVSRMTGAGPHHH